jgi:hypothetical protein
MYCLSCGTAVTPNLSYCNHCGARLSRAKGDGVTKSSELKAETLVGAIAAVFIFGLGAIIGLMAAMKYVFNQRDDLGLIIFFTSLSFLIMVAVEGVFIRMLLGRKRSAEAGNTKPFEEQAAKELDDAKARVLPEPASSVTEHTTRTLEPVVSQHKTG